MLTIGDTVDNKTICDVFGVANMGGIRVNRGRNLIVLMSNPDGSNAYRNGWKGETLHFVGRGSTGPQQLSRQNATLAKSKLNGGRIYLFEASGKGGYAAAIAAMLATSPKPTGVQ